MRRKQYCDVTYTNCSLAAPGVGGVSSFALKPLTKTHSIMDVVVKEKQTAFGIPLLKALTKHVTGIYLSSAPR